NQSGTVDIHLAARSNWHTLWPNAHAESRGIAKVRTLSLDEIVESRNLPTCDLVRMDIEGYEVVAIEGMRRTLARHHPKLFIELHGNIVGSEAILKLVDDLAAQGYRFAYAVDRPRDDPWRGWRNHVEALTLEQLRRDARLNTRLRPLDVLFSRDAINLRDI